MPCYPALALLLGCAMATEGIWIRRGTYMLCGVAAAAALVTLTLFFLVRHVPAVGDISAALSSHPGAYKLSLGHMEDLTIESFAYLRIPLLVAAAAFLVGAIGAFRSAGMRAFLSAALMMVLFFHAARLAMVVFDPYLSSRPLAEALLRAPEGKLIVARPYYTFSSVFFYANRTALILNGRINNLEYGSYAPGAPDVFIDDARFKELWLQPERYYLAALDSGVPELEGLVGSERLILLAASGGKRILTNHSLTIVSSSRNAEQGRWRRFASDAYHAEMPYRPDTGFAACQDAVRPVENESFPHLTISATRAGFLELRGAYTMANHVYCN